MPSAPTTLQLGIEVQVDQANAAISAVNQKLEDFDKRSRQSSSSLDHGVSSMQASSAALRTLEGGLTNNVRAAERFLTIIPGLGDVLKTAFPVVGAIAFGGVLLELYDHITKLQKALKDLQDAPQRIAQEFLSLNQTLRVSNDEMRVSNDRLENEIAKLQGRPQNGLKIALDEARVAADQLSESLARDATEVLNLLTKEQVGGLKSLLTGTQGTTDLTQQFKQFRDQLAQITIDTNSKVDATQDPKRQTELFQQATEQRKVAIASETQYLQHQLDVAVQLQKAKEQAASHPSFTDTPYGPVVSRGGATDTADQAARISLLRGAIENLSQEQQRMLLETQHTADQSQKDALDAEKKSLTELQKLELKAKMDVQNATAQWYGGAENAAREFAKFQEDLLKLTNGKLLDPAALKAFQEEYAAFVIRMHGEAVGSAQKETQKSISDSLKGDMSQDRSFIAVDDYANEVLKRQQDVANQGLSYQEQALAQSRDMQLKALDSMDARTVDDKLKVEQQKLSIETDYLRKAHDLQVAKINADADAQLADADVRAQKMLLGAGDDQNAQRRINSSYADEQAAINAGRNQQIGAVNGSMAAQMQEAQDAAAKAQTQAVQEQYHDIYNSILKETDSFLSIVEDHSRNTWQRIADNLKKAFTDALNPLISSQLAGSIAGLVTGQSPNGEHGKAGGLIMGQMPAQNAMGVAGSLLGPGGTSGFSGPVSAGGSSAMSIGGFGGGGYVPSNWTNAYSDSSHSVAVASAAGPPMTMPTAAVAGLGSLDPLTQTVMGQAMSRGASDSELGTILTSSGYDPTDFGLSAPQSPMSTIAGAPQSWGSGTAGGYNPAGVSATGPSSGSASKTISSLFQSGSGLLKGLGNNPTAINGLLVGMGGSMLLSGAMNPQQAYKTSNTLSTVAGAGMLGYGIADKLGAGLGPFGAAIGVGGGLVVNGSERGSVGGTLESTAGGALAGAEIGSLLPGIGTAVGAGIGALVGGLSGLIGMFVGNALDHVKRVVKQSYGISVDNSTAQAILNIANQSYGGDIPLAVSSAQVRQMLSLYSQATGQGNGQRIYQQVTGYTVADAGGSVYNLAAAQDGTSSMSYGGTIPTLGVGVTPGASGTSGLSMAGTSISLQLNGQATTSLLNGQIASAAPTAVVAGMQSQRLGATTAAAMFSPGLLTH